MAWINVLSEEDWDGPLGELYADVKDRRPRVHDITAVARQPESEDDLRRIRFAVFDILSIDGQPPGDVFADTWKIVEKVFGEGQAIHPVQAKTVADADGVQRLFESWVENEGAEGLVVRSDTAGIFKVKPQHTLDAAVIGFTESVGDRQGLLHDLLLGVMRHDGTLQVLSRVGGGFDEGQRREMLSGIRISKPRVSCEATADRR